MQTVLSCAHYTNESCYRPPCEGLKEPCYRIKWLGKKIREPGPSSCDYEVSPLPVTSSTEIIRKSKCRNVSPSKDSTGLSREGRIRSPGRAEELLGDWKSVAPGQSPGWKSSSNRYKQKLWKKPKTPSIHVKNSYRHITKPLKKQFSEEK